jgi:hypothetical protein
VILAIAAAVCVVSMHVNRNACSEVGVAFAWALMQDRIPRARSFSSPEQWDRIDAWVTQHDPFRICLSGSLDPDETQALWTCDPRPYPDDSPEDWNCDYTFTCVSDSGNGTRGFAVDDIILQQTENGCRVSDWGGVREWGD